VDQNSKWTDRSCISSINGIDGISGLTHALRGVQAYRLAK